MKRHILQSTGFGAAAIGVVAAIAWTGSPASPGALVSVVTFSFLAAGLAFGLSERSR